MELAKRLVAISLSFVALFAFHVSVSSAAGFSTNFQGSTDLTWQQVNQQGACSFTQGCENEFGNGDPTPFSQVLVNIGGVTYFHTIVGDPASGFAIESYTPYGAGPNVAPGNIEIPQSGGSFSPTGGGNERGALGLNSLTPESNSTFLLNAMNDANVFGNYHVSGTGSQTPTSTVFRMVMTSADGTMSMEVDKPFLDKKPMISQTIQDGTMSAVFVADMTALSYSDMTTPIKITNSVTINDPQMPAGAGNFEMALAQHPDVTAGQYTFDATGVGWDTTYGWDSPGSHYTYGQYIYAQGTGFDPLNFDWTSVFDFNQNALSCDRQAGNGDARIVNAGGASCPGHP